MLVATLLVAVLFITACGGAAPADPVDPGDGGAEVDTPVEPDGDEDENGEDVVVGDDGGTVIFAIGADAGSLDPHRVNDNPSAIIMNQIYDTLVEMDGDGNITPHLATSWEQIDDLTWEFTLRDDVYFHNGEHMTAEDVAFTFIRAREPEAGPIQIIVNMIDQDSIEVVDEYTVRIGTYFPFAPLLSHLAHPATAIVNQVAVEQFGEDYGQNPVGTGAFMFESWEPQVAVRMVRNDNFWGNVPAFERLESRVIPEQNTRAIALETGEVDLALELHPMDHARIAGHPDLYHHFIDGMGQTLMYMNNEVPGLNDPRVRQAIVYAIDVEQMVSVVWEGTRVFANGFLPPNVFGAVPGNNPYRQNVERAQELMEEAGFGDGLSLTITTNGDNSVRVMMATIMEQQLGEIGIDIEINLMEFAAMIEMLDRNEGEHELVILGWTTVTGDADYGLFPLYHSSNHGSGGNRSNFDNARFDELVEVGRENPDTATRAAAYAEAQEILAEYVPTMMIDFSTWSVGAQSFITNFAPSPQGHHFFGDIVIAR